HRWRDEEYAESSLRADHELRRVLELHADARSHADVIGAWHLLCVGGSGGPHESGQTNDECKVSAWAHGDVYVSAQDHFFQVLLARFLLVSFRRLLRPACRAS